MSRRRLAVLLAVLLAAAAAYWLLLRDRSVEAHLRVPRPAATLNSGSEQVVVGADGRAIRWYPLGPGTELPRLPDAPLPESGRLAGPLLEQARVLGAVPAPLRPYVERSFHGSDGVDVVLDSGIEVRFGDDSQAERKWEALATVLADPTVVALDYVDVSVPSRPVTAGTGHLLPPPP